MTNNIVETFEMSVPVSIPNQVMAAGADVELWTDNSTTTERRGAYRAGTGSTGIACALTGRLTRDANDLRYTGRGDAMVGFSVAVQGAKAPTGGAQRAWVTIFGERAVELDGLLKEAVMVRVQGRLCLNSWPTPSGERQFGLAVTADTVELLDETIQVSQRPPRAPRRERRRRQDDQVIEQSPAMSPSATIRSGRNVRSALGLDDDSDLQV